MRVKDEQRKHACERDERRDEDSDQRHLHEMPPRKALVADPELGYEFLYGGLEVGKDSPVVR